MKLQKLVYIAHGWHLAVTGDPLLRDPVEAWPYGPVAPVLYRAFKDYGSSAIVEPGKIWDPDKRERVVPDIAIETKSMDVIVAVWNAYKKFSAIQLSAMTHKEGTPWHKVSQGQSSPRDIPIPDSIIRSHYVELANKRD